ncbi:MAG TPA: ABC transporter permease [Thermoanaerobaculia bacterium]|nr:ABC transporter permease [Thermoanaerobaculia bacterium]
MGLAELLRVALTSIRAHKLRSFLTLLGIIIGVTTIVGVAGVINGLERYVQERIITLSPDVYVVTKFGIIRGREEFFEALKRPDLDFRDYELLQERLTRASAIAADLETGAPVRHRGRRLAGMRVHGSTANLGTVLNLDLEAGRFFTEADDAAAARVAVIGWDIRDELYPGLDPVGRDLTVGESVYRVIGVVAQQGRTLGQSQDNQVWLPISTFRKSWGRRGSLTFVVRARDGVAGLEASMDEVRAVLRARRHTDFRAADPFGMVTADNLQELWRQISTAAFLLTLLISAVSLGVGGIVIANIMLVGVAERTREIGLRRAVGARKRDIRRQFLLEAALLATGGGLVGAALGAGAAVGVEEALSFPARVTPLVILLGLGLAAGVGMLAGYFPARRASNLLVVDALRDET